RAGRPDERADEADPGEPEPDRPCAREPGECSPHLGAEHLGPEGDREERQCESSSGEEEVVLALHIYFDLRWMRFVVQYHPVSRHLAPAACGVIAGVDFGHGRAEACA